MAPEHEAIDRERVERMAAQNERNREAIDRERDARIAEERAADREIREGRPRLVAVLRAGGFPAIAAVFAAQGASIEEEREYVGEPAPAESRSARMQAMAFSDPGLNLFRPPPMAGSQVEQAMPSVLPEHEATPAPAVQPSDGERAARAVLAQRGVHNPSEQQVRDVLTAAPWLGELPPPPAPLFVDSTQTDAT